MSDVSYRFYEDAFSEEGVQTNAGEQDEVWSTARTIAFCVFVCGSFWASLGAVAYVLLN